MESKKTPQADLNNYSTTFLLLGLVAFLFWSWQALELKTYEREIAQDTLNLSDTDEEETKEINVEEIKMPEPEPVQAAPEEIEVVEDEKEVEESTFESTEDDEKQEVKEVEDIVVEDEPEPDVEVAFQFIQNPPVFPGCEGKKGAKALKDCMSKKIQSFVGNNFDKEIAEDLGISGRVRIMAQFTIDKTGRVTKIQTRSKYKDLEKEARRVISKLPKVKPGQQRNRPVKVTYTLPIIFQIADD